MSSAAYSYGLKFLNRAVDNLGAFVNLDQTLVSRIMEEMQVEPDPALNRHQALTLGMLLGCDKVVFGNLGNFGGRYYVDVELLDVMTAETERKGAAEAESEDEIEPAFADAVRMLAD